MVEESIQTRVILNSTISVDFKIFKQIQQNQLSVKMVPLLTCQRVLTWHCVPFVDETPNRLFKLLHYVFILIVFIINLCSFASFLIAFLTFLPTDLEGSLYASFQATLLFSTTYSVIVTLLLRHHISALFDGLLAIYNTSKHFYCMCKLHRLSNWLYLKFRCKRWYAPIFCRS